MFAHQRRRKTVSGIERSLTLPTPEVKSFFERG